MNLRWMVEFCCWWMAATVHCGVDRPGEISRLCQKLLWFTSFGPDQLGPSYNLLHNRGNAIAFTCTTAPSVDVSVRAMVNKMSWIRTAHTNHSAQVEKFKNIKWNYRISCGSLKLTITMCPGECKTHIKYIIWCFSSANLAAVNANQRKTTINHHSNHSECSALRCAVLCNESIAGRVSEKSSQQ